MWYGLGKSIGAGTVHRIRRGAAVFFAVVLAGCGHAGPAVSSPPTPATPVTIAPGSLPRPDHVVVVIFENEDRSEVIGSPNAPYLTSLAHAGAEYTNSHGLAHPSQANYVALIAGATLGVTNDHCPQDLGDQPNLIRQLLDKGITVAGYFESMPSSGYKGCRTDDGLYARKHNAFADFSNIPDSANLPFTQFPTDPTMLPTVSFVVPNMCNDMHDCPVSEGDTWMKNHLSAYADWAGSHNSLLIVTFDEDSGTDANLIPTVLSGQMVAPGTKTERIDHYTVLRTLEEMYGLPALGYAASSTPLTDWKK